jgi:hypothetical protein
VEEVEKMRAKLRLCRWSVREVPVKSGGQENPHISRWRLMAARGDQTISIDDPSLEVAFRRLCNMLGLA